MQSEKTGFRKDIEGLRAVAVLLVVAYHARILAFNGGFIGVDVFFVVSGYLITGILVKEVVRSGRISLVQFYARRIRRLLPGSVAMLIGTVIATCYFLPPYEQSVISRSAFATFAYLSNVYFVRVSGDYFAADMAGNPLLHTWSLAVEEQFYFIWPLLILFVFKLRPSRKSLCIVMASIGAISFTAMVFLTLRNQPIAFFLMPPRAWEFAVGGLASQIPIERIRNNPKLMRVLGWVGLLMVLVAGFLITPSGFPGIKVMLPVLGTAAILIAGLDEGHAGVNSVLGTGIFQYVGQRSYALYLWHWPVLVMVAVRAEPFSLKIRLLCVLASLILAEITHRLVENPIRFQVYLQGHAKLCIAASLLVMGIGTGVASAWRYWSVHTASYATYGKAMLDLPDDARMLCENGFGESIPHECDFGSKAPSKTVVLFGDSHIEQWLPAFQEIAKRKNWKIVLFVKSSCPALAISTSVQQAQGEDTWCRTWRELAIERIHQLHPTAVVLSNATSYKKIDLPDVLQSPGEWNAGARKTFATLQVANLPLVFLRDTPWARYDVTQCLSRANWNQFHSCPSLLRSTALNDDVFRAQIEGAQGLKKVAFVDMSNRICGKIFCDLSEGGTIIYRDNNHLTATFLRGLSTYLYDELVRVVPDLES